MLLSNLKFNLFSFFYDCDVSHNFDLFVSLKSNLQNCGNDTLFYYYVSIFMKYLISN